MPDLTRDEFNDKLADAVRKGSVQAMKLWWEIHRANDEAEPIGFDALDEVAEARAKKRAA